MKFAGLVCLIVLASPVTALAGSAENGRLLASHWCTECHITAPQTSGTAIDSAPPFMQIANTQGRTPGYLRAFLANPHPPMPNFNLSRVEIDDFVTYILSLRKK